MPQGQTETLKCPVCKAWVDAVDKGEVRLNLNFYDKSLPPIIVRVTAYECRESGSPHLFAIGDRATYGQVERMLVSDP